jgi:hypothetical protein
MGQNMGKSQNLNLKPEAGPVLTKAVLRAADKLGLSATELSKIIGSSGSTISRMKKGDVVFQDGSKEFELGVLFVRLFRSLDTIVGGQEDIAKAWLRNENSALAGIPAQKIEKIAGMMDVIGYLDARRAIV